MKPPFVVVVVSELAEATTPWAVWEAKEGYVQRARNLLTKGVKLNPGDPPLLQVGRRKLLHPSLKAHPVSNFDCEKGSTVLST